VTIAGVVRCVALLTVLVAAGCRSRGPLTPTQAGLNTNNIVDIPAQIEAQQSYKAAEQITRAETVMRQSLPPPSGRKRSVLCLSGGGAYGAYTAGVLCGWTTRGDRPNFDVVTGVSTGGLIAPLAFLGPAYDHHLKRLYTTLSNRDIYTLRPVRGVFSDALADTRPLAHQVDLVLTDKMVQDLAIEHSKGRRLYLGTTVSQGKRFVAWDIGEIACRGRPEDRELIKRIILGSSAIPGFFPPSAIPITVDGKQFTENHVDGSVSYSLFLRPPYSPPGTCPEPMSGVDVYAIVAGKLFADPEVIRPWILSEAAANITTLTYAQTRGDVTRLWSLCLISGMNFHLAAIPETTPAPKTSTTFDPAEMTQLFNAGARHVIEGCAWRSLPPGASPGEDPLIRASTNLNLMPRSAAQVR
jgi:predicted acylesterase/phospholipase RssA